MNKNLQNYNYVPIHPFNYNINIHVGYIIITSIG